MFPLILFVGVIISTGSTVQGTSNTDSSLPALNSTTPPSSLNEVFISNETIITTNSHGTFLVSFLIQNKTSSTNPGSLNKVLIINGTIITTISYENFLVSFRIQNITNSTTPEEGTTNTNSSSSVVNATTTPDILAIESEILDEYVMYILNLIYDRVLKRHQMTMKQLYKVPFERNSERVKALRYQYVQLEVHETTHILVFVDEAVFNLSKGPRSGRNLIGHRATIDTPGQRGAILQCVLPFQRMV
ncbi:uncharacterized protein LOC128521668 [Clarias gariepinus]|uniref:uncharacterized protein LOC128521668 n=1 Tax=Clarias gariepinus TaxID=13013 RepID=UPI00234D6A61|nr:uncharacterized protein LOC128521668 [Clarias gariepinus]